MVVFVAGVIEGERDFNYWLCFSQPLRKIHGLLLGSRDLSASLESEACLADTHPSSEKPSHLACSVPWLCLWEVYLCDHEHEALLGNLRFFLGSSEHPAQHASSSLTASEGEVSFLRCAVCKWPAPC